MFNVDELAYVETLFGHQDEITSLCAMGAKDRCLSTGGRDRSVRLWKILEESQLVFRVSRLRSKKRAADADGDNSDAEEPEVQASESVNENVVKCLEEDNTGSVETIAWLDDETWITGTDGGALSLWSIQRKKPLFSLANAHGRTIIGRNDSEQVDSENYRGTVDAGTVDVVAADVADKLGANFPVLSNPFWITAIAAVPFSDLLVTGSCDGKLRFWRRRIGANPGLRDGDGEESGRLPPLREFASLSIPGFINGLQFSASGRYLVVAAGKEHRFGRWQRIAAAKNAVFTVDLGTLFAIEK